jgi:apolipoprotein N-acyltransferase
MYDIYNTGIYLEKNKKAALYYKSKLVPGVEKMPYPQVFKFLEKYAIDEGGISGSLGVQEEREVFDVQGKFKIAPVICYESVFGEYVSDYVKKGANVICIITNDGWWGNTPGYREHFNYARLRAIETRRTVLRSANTGISGVINEKGISSHETNWWEPAVVEATFTPSSYLTFYVKHGDYLALVCCWGSLVWLVLGVFKIRF